MRRTVLIVDDHRTFRDAARALLEAAGFAVVGLAGDVIGLASAWAAVGWDDFLGWLPDLVVGLVFIGCGVQAMARDRGTAFLLAGVGFTWFLANFWTDAGRGQRVVALGRSSVRVEAESR